MFQLLVRYLNGKIDLDQLCLQINFNESIRSPAKIIFTHYVLQILGSNQNEKWNIDEKTKRIIQREINDIKIALSSRSDEYRFFLNEYGGPDQIYGNEVMHFEYPTISEMTQDLLHKKEYSNHIPDLLGLFFESLTSLLGLFPITLLNNIISRLDEKTNKFWDYLTETSRY